MINIQIHFTTKMFLLLKYFDSRSNGIHILQFYMVVIFRLQFMWITCSYFCEYHAPKIKYIETFFMCLIYKTLILWLSCDVKLIYYENFLEFNFLITCPLHFGGVRSVLYICAVILLIPVFLIYIILLLNFSFSIYIILLLNFIKIVRTCDRWNTNDKTMWYWH